MSCSHSINGGYRKQLSKFLDCHLRSIGSESNVKTILKSYKLKSKTVSQGLVELTLEVRVKKENIEFMDKLTQQDKIIDVALVSYDGEYVS